MAEIYFGKINLVSSQIGDVLYNTTSLKSILTKLFMVIKDDITYTYTTMRKIDEDTTVREDIEYSLTVKEKTKSDLQGYLHKKSYLYYKDFDKNNKKRITKKVENTESSEFYYDIYREMVGYQRTQRFGYKEFLYGFQGILNAACENSNLDYSLP